MTSLELREILDHLDDTLELVLPGLRERDDTDALVMAWLIANREAGVALRSWCRRGGQEPYTLYRAAADRADAAQDALALRARRSRN